MFPWFGWLTTIVFLGIGVFIELTLAKGFRFTPITLRRIERFKSIKRGYYSLIFIFALAAIASLDHLLVGNEALAVKHNGNWSFPAFTREIEKGHAYGIKGDEGQGPPSYRDLQTSFADGSGDNQVVMPLLPLSLIHI